VARPDSRKCRGRRDAGLEAARRLKEILREGSAPPRPLPALPPPPSLEERRTLTKIPRRSLLLDDDQDE
jgi:hypothetical protein